MGILALLVFLALVLGIITVVGHGIWVVLAAIFRGGRRESDERGKDWTYPPSSSIRYAGRGSEGMTPLQELQRQVTALEASGRIDKDSANRLRAAIVEEQSFAESKAAARDAERQPAASSVVEEPIVLTPVEQSGPPLGAPPPVESLSDEAALLAAQARAEELAGSTGSESPAFQKDLAADEAIGERAKKFVAARSAVAEQGDGESAGAAAFAAAGDAPREPAMPVSRLFAAFMEENNIRWGELVGGLLIVGCSVALVISLWSQITGRPLLQFVLFNGVTAALFGIGVYTDRRWKIHTTSHGVLVIATLLVPLNFLALAAFMQKSPPTDLLPMAGESLSLALFASLVYMAGRTLVRNDVSLLVAGVMVPCLMQLLVRRFAGPNMSFGSLYLLAGVPLVSYLVSVGVSLHRARGEMIAEEDQTAEEDRADGVQSLSGSVANRVLLFLGIVSTATLMPLALLLHYTPPARETLHWLSPLVLFSGVPATATGLLFWQRLRAKEKLGLQTGGIAVGALGVMLMGAAVVFAWPDPAMLVPTSVALFVAMLAVALWFGLPAAHFPAAAALAAAVVVGVYVVRGDLAWRVPDGETVRRVLLSATTGYVLLPIVAVYSCVAWLLMRAGRDESGRIYGFVATAAAAASLGLGLWFGFARQGDSSNITWLLLIYTAGALAAGVGLNRVDLTRAGSALLLATLIQGLVYRYGEAWQLSQPWVTAFLAHASLASILAVAATTVSRMRRGEPSLLAAAQRVDVWRSLVWSSVATAAVASGWIFAVGPQATNLFLAVHLIWLAVVWCVLSILLRIDWAFSLAQVAAVTGIVFAVAAFVEGEAWYASLNHPWLDPWFLQLAGMVLAGYAVLLQFIRWIVARSVQGGEDALVESADAGWSGLASRLLDPPWPAVDRLLSAGLVLLTVALATYAVGSGVAQELSLVEVKGVREVPPLEHFTMRAISHAHTMGAWAWLLVACVTTSVASGLWQRKRQWRVMGLTVLAAVVCGLISARWTTEVAVASALRWWSAGLFAVGSIGYWLATRSSASNDDHRGEGVARLSSAVDGGESQSTGVLVRNWLLAFVVLVYSALGAYLVLAVLSRAEVWNDVETLWAWLVAWAVVAGVLALLIPYVQLSGAANETRKVAFNWRQLTRNVLLMLAIAPLCVLLMFVVASVLERHPIVGPEASSWFRQIGFDVSYGVPLAMVAVAFVGHAIRDRSSGFAFAAGILANLVASIVVLVRLVRGGGNLDAAAWVLVSQVNAIVAGVVAAVWEMVVRWAWGRGAKPQAAGEARGWPLLLVTQVALAAAFCAVFLLPATVSLTLDMPPATWAKAADGLLGWSALALAMGAAAAMQWRTAVGQSQVAIAVAAIVAIVALTVARYDSGNWEAYHTLLSGTCLAAWLLPAIMFHGQRLIAGDLGNQPGRTLSWTALPTRLFAAAAVFLALWGYADDPGSPWWTVAALAAIGARNLWIAWREYSRVPVWITASLFVVATSIAWLDWGRQFSSTTGAGKASELLWVNVLCVAVVAMFSVLVERRIVAFVDGALSDAEVAPADRDSIQWLQPRYRAMGVGFHRFAAWAIGAVLLLTISGGLWADVNRDSFGFNAWLAWAAWLAGVATAIACWWDVRVRWATACAYCVGLTGVGLYLDGLNLQPPLFQWALANALASYSLATSWLWYMRDRVAGVLVRWRVPAAMQRAATEVERGQHTVREGAAPAIPTDGSQAWLVMANILLGFFVLMLVVGVELTLDSFVQRMVGACAVAAQAVAIGLLAYGQVRTPLQYLSLVWGVLFAVAFGGAFLSPDYPEPVLHRLIVSGAALAACVVVYGFGLVKFLRRENEWTRAAAKLVPPMAVLTVVLLLAVLGVETMAFMQRGQVQIALWALVLVAVSLLFLIGATLAAALLPGRDPLGLSERGRTIYVYVAEGLAALLFLHIRVTMPWLFGGWFLQFWPLVVMVLAFIGVGLGEVFQRRKQLVLAEPLRTTGAFLPLLPALGYWVLSSQVHYSLLLFSIGLLYASLSVLRQSFFYGMLAALAANGSLWYLLHDRQGLSFVEHPQLWLIPPALSALVAGYINRDRLSREQSAALRYASAIVIYVSSTMDVFINGVANAPWLPAVLAGLSIVGVLAGILFRVRAFLYLGITFLVVSIMTIIWHAAIHQERTYILWIAGIVTGGLIFAMFGLFEKRRDDVLRVVEELKEWE